METIVFLVPALLVVVLGYSVGYAVWEAAGLPGDPEVAGWTAGVVLLAVLTWLLVSWRRRVRRRGRRG
ncbi:hypothetical protein [Blastococcus saxobsidens]|uniref:Uncharacterized protein n=1 Tax=Blastococcus saxobsidens (strain DD2) TaxID=1146883 RepID=H6RM64_BLASD|nr:hypothetical protein [Blastococcus saxobsidens]CCG01306.1 conserved protein of unknown function [Blastococcus saxobsidens DD2]